MMRKFVIFAAVILLITSGALADIGQVQGFSIGSLNMVGRCGPVGSAHGGTMVAVSHAQQVHKPYHSITARQEEKGKLVQHGVAKGAGGVSGVVNKAAVKGMQGQRTKPYGSTMQGQGLKVNLGQVAMKQGGVGGTQGVQGFVGSQGQTISTPRATAATAQMVGIKQYSAVSGRKGSNGIVVNTVNVEMGQKQIITGPRY